MSVNLPQARKGLSYEGRRASSNHSDLNLLSYLQSIFHLHTKIPHGAGHVGVPQQQLDSSQIFGLLVDQCRLATPQRVSSVDGGIKTNAFDPFLDDPGILMGGYVVAPPGPARPQIVHAR